MFKRWTVMHFRDLLNLPVLTPESNGIVRALRYTNSAGELFYTIHADDIAIWASDAYKNRSGRLDLESTRNVEKGEEAVLQGEHAFGGEPMVWDICNAEFGILAEVDRDMRGGESYHELPIEWLSGKGTRPSAPESVLVTLTYTGDEGGCDNPPELLTSLQSSVVKRLQPAYKDLSDGKMYTSLYRHLPDQQPDMHPIIGEGKHGNGSWVLCVFVEANVSDALRSDLKAGLEDNVDKMGGGVRVGVWSGEVFML